MSKNVNLNPLLWWWKKYTAYLFALILNNCQASAQPRRCCCRRGSLHFPSHFSVCTRGPSSFFLGTRPPAQHSCSQLRTHPSWWFTLPGWSWWIAYGFNAQCRRCFCRRYITESSYPIHHATEWDNSKLKKKTPRGSQVTHDRKVFHLQPIDLALVVVFTASYDYVDGHRRAIIEMNTQYFCPQVSPRRHWSLYTNKRRVIILRVISSFYLCKYYQP